VGEQLGRIVDAIDIESRFGQEMRVPSLAAGTVENAGAGGKPQDVEETGRVPAVAGRIEQSLVLDEIALVEVGLPPVGTRFAGRGKRRFGLPALPAAPFSLPGQKNTGSR
jgi:hypothetical protein